MIPSVPIIAASLPADPGFADNLQYQIIGLLVVLLTLGGIAVMLWLAGKLFIIRDRHKAAAAMAADVAATHVPPEVHAAIAAAVSVALEDDNFVIRGIHSADPRTNLAWGIEGRRSIYASKKLR